MAVSRLNTRGGGASSYPTPRCTPMHGDTPHPCQAISYHPEGAQRAAQLCRHLHALSTVWGDQAACRVLSPVMGMECVSWGLGVPRGGLCETLSAGGGGCGLLVVLRMWAQPECPVCLPGVTGCGDGAQDTGARAGGPEMLGGWSPLKAPERDQVVGGLQEGALQCGCGISGADALGRLVAPLCPGARRLGAGHAEAGCSGAIYSGAGRSGAGFLPPQ